jgi:aspartyl-tRNA(Asn)/glutamyl-tRNA(Gln) amidotransferase subunit A
MTELLDQGAAAIAAAVRRGKVKARDVAEAAIARVEARNEALTAIVDFNPAEARSAADTIDARRNEGFDGPILGVPYTVKDTTWVAGRRVTNGSLLWKDFIPPRDAIAVERLKKAGGVFLGMTNTPEMAAKGHTENKVYGATRHPMNPALTPGGSSGGAAAALAAGFTPIALGTDGGGSGRRPASHCGVVGLKTSAGAIPSPFGFGGAYGPLYGVVAPMGRSVADAKVAFEVMAGPDPRDPHSVATLDLPPPSNPRIAYSPRLGMGVAVDADVMSAVDAAVDKLRAGGWRIEAADVAWPEGTSETAFSAVNAAASALLYGERQAKDQTLFGDNLTGLIERGRTMHGTDVVAAFRFADACARAVAAFFTEYDYLLTPTTACVSWPVEQVYPKVIENRQVGPRAATRCSRRCSIWRWCQPSPCPAAEAATACRSACRSWLRACTTGPCWRWRSGPRRLSINNGAGVSV